MQRYVLRVAQCNLPDLIRLNEATYVPVDHREDLHYFPRCFVRQEDLSEEIPLVERFGNCGKTEKGSFQTHTYREALGLVVSCYSNSLTVRRDSIHLYLHEYFCFLKCNTFPIKQIVFISFNT